MLEPTKTALYKNLLELELGDKYQGTVLGIKILLGQLTLEELLNIKNSNLEVN